MDSSVINLAALRRLDSAVTSTLHTAKHVVLYQLKSGSGGSQSWDRKGIEGPLFLVKRQSAPAYRLFVLNRKSIENLTQDIAVDTKFELKEQFVFLEAKNQGVLGIWFYDQSEAKLTFDTLNKLSSDLANAAKSRSVLDSSPHLAPMLLAQRSINSTGRTGSQSSLADIQMQEQQRMLNMLAAAAGTSEGKATSDNYSHEGTTNHHKSSSQSQHSRTGSSSHQQQQQQQSLYYGQSSHIPSRDNSALDNLSQEDARAHLLNLLGANSAPRTPSAGQNNSHSHSSPSVLLQQQGHNSSHNTRQKQHHGETEATQSESDYLMSKLANLFPTQQSSTSVNSQQHSHDHRHGHGSSTSGSTLQPLRTMLDSSTQAADSNPSPKLMTPAFFQGKPGEGISGSSALLIGPMPRSDFRAKIVELMQKDEVVFNCLYERHCKEPGKPPRALLLSILLEGM